MSNIATHYRPLAAACTDSRSNALHINFGSPLLDLIPLNPDPHAHDRLRVERLPFSKAPCFVKWIEVVDIPQAVPVKAVLPNSAAENLNLTTNSESKLSVAACSLEKFMADDSFSGISNTPFPFGTQGEPNSVTDATLRPVTVRQILDAQRASGSTFTIDGVLISRVTTVVDVVSIVVDRNNNSNIYQLEDGSRGRITARHFGPQVTDEDPNGLEGISEHTYVRVVGRLSRFKERNSLMVDRIYRVSDPHELYHHLLEAMVAMLSITRGPPPSTSYTIGLAPIGFGSSSQYVGESSLPPQTQPPPPSPHPRPPSPPVATAAERTPQIDAHPDNDDFDDDEFYTPLTGTPPRGPSPLLDASLADFAEITDPLAHLSILQRDILLYIQHAEQVHPSEEGIYVGAIARGVAHPDSGITADHLTLALDELLENGNLYCTVDESHFKAFI